MPTQKERKEASLRKFLEAAEAILLEKGYERATIQEIVDRAGLTKGAFYHYFANKDELFWELLQTKASNVREAFWQSVQAVGGLEAPTEVMVQRTLALSIDPIVQAVYAHYLSIASHNEEATARIRHMHELWRGLAIEGLTAAKMANLISQKVDVEKVAALIFAVTMGIGMQTTQEPNKFPFDEYAHAVKTLMLSMIQGDLFLK